MRVFTETQRFDQWWLKGIMAATLLITIGSLIMTYQEIPTGEQTEFYTVAIPTILIVAFVSFGIFFIKLETKIDSVGIHYGFWPFQKKMRTALWHDIDKVYVREYRPITEFGGWGYKFSLSGHGKVYNTKGNKGIQIVFKDNKKTLIGTSKPEEAQQILTRFKTNTV